MAFNFKIKSAERVNIFTKIALFGSSGSGKTFTSLVLATGMSKELKRIGQKHKILMANTEGSRGLYYANEFEYDIIDLDPPYEPELFVDLIQHAVNMGYGVLIIDTSTSEWSGQGGCLEIQQRLGGKYNDWGKVTPRHRKYVDELVGSDIHIICTTRGKDEYSQEKDDRGKTSVKKIGVGAEQRNGFEYEFTCTFLLDQQTNAADCQKDNTHMFEKKTPWALTEQDGINFIKWANSADKPVEKKPNIVNSKEEDISLEDLQKDILSMCKEHGGSKNKVLVEIMKKYEQTGNPLKIESVYDLLKLKKEIEEME